VKIHVTIQHASYGVAECGVRITAACTSLDFKVEVIQPRLRHGALARIITVKTGERFLVPRRIVDSWQTNEKDVDVVLSILEPRLYEPAHIGAIARKETVLW
jgi:hypothetical protein